MLDLFEMYTLADPLFFEEPSRLADGSRHALVVPAEFSVSALEPPTGWKRTRSGLWQVVAPEDPSLPEQGWKIHVSATVDGADATCRDVWDYCTGHGIAFKYLLDKNILVAANAKYAARASSGKLLTVYPRDEEELERTLHGLSALVGGRPGPYVLSDLRWDRGPLYVRYGAFRERWCLDAHGSRIPALRAPDGS
ncbi:serine/threonine protein kinase, partial [Nocardiopsis tropica]|nr:serine/threonine protein kinase [Nocardiopsis tropica]